MNNLTKASDVKQKLIDHLYGMDLTRLNAPDLNSYAFAVKTVCDMEQLGYAELMSGLLCAAKKDGGAEDG